MPSSITGGGSNSSGSGTTSGGSSSDASSQTSANSTAGGEQYTSADAANDSRDGAAMTAWPSDQPYNSPNVDSSAAKQ